MIYSVYETIWTFGTRKIKATCYGWFSCVDFLFCDILKDIISLRNSILFYRYGKETDIGRIPESVLSNLHSP